MSRIGDQPVDVIIIGAGIIGCAVAYNLARRGLSVRVFDRGPVAGEQSSRAWGFIRQQGRHPAEVPVAALSSRLWPGLEQELQADLEYAREGIVVTAETDADEARLDAALRVARSYEVGSRMLTASQVSELAPGSAPIWRSGLFTPEDGHAEPGLATAAFATAARRHGATFHEHVPVHAIEVTGGAASGVVAAGRSYASSAVVCAAGIGTPDLCRKVGLSLPIKAVRAPVAQTRPASRSTGGKAAFWAPHVAFRPKRGGSFYLGNGYREVDAEFDLTLEAIRHANLFLPSYWINRSIVKLSLNGALFEDLSRRLAADRFAEPWSEPKVNTHLIAVIERNFYAAFPGLNGLGLAKTWAGRIDATPDMIPIICAARQPGNFYVAAGFSGHGLSLAPAIGQLLCEWVMDGRPSLDLTSFRAERFAEDETRPKAGAL